MRVPKLVKRLGAAVLGAGTSLVIAACYGAYYGGEYMRLVSGRVTTTDGTGIPEMRVCADAGYGLYCESTHAQGEYSVWVPEEEVDYAYSNGFLVQVRDVDGLTNGLYEDKDVQVPPYEAPADLDIAVDEVPLL